MFLVIKVALSEIALSLIMPDLSSNRNDNNPITEAGIPNGIYLTIISLMIYTVNIIDICFKIFMYFDLSLYSLRVVYPAKVHNISRETSYTYLFYNIVIIIILLLYRLY